MKKYLFTYVLFVISFNLFGQKNSEIIYFDENWKAVEDEDFATYKAVYALPSNSNFEKRFVIRRVFDGSVYQDGIYYEFDKYDGTKQKLQEYKKYDKHGTVLEQLSGDSTRYIISQFYDNGKEKSILPYTNGLVDGECVFFAENENKIIVRPVKDNQPLPYYEYYDNGIKTRYNTKTEEQITEGVTLSDCSVIYDKDGSEWIRFIKNGLIIHGHLVYEREFGKYWSLKLSISNYTRHPINVSPQNITAYGSTSYNRTPIKTYLADEYIKRVEKKQKRSLFWAGFVSSFANAMAAQNYATTTVSAGNYSVTAHTHYFDSYAYQSAMNRSNEELYKFNAALLNEKEALRYNYIRGQMLKPGESVTGFVCFPYVDEELIFITLKLVGRNYPFKFNALKLRKL